MRNISDIHSLIRFIERKEKGTYTLDSEIDALLDAGQLEVLEDYFRLYGLNQVVHDALNPFKQNYQFTSDPDGVVSLPSNYLHLLGGVFTVTGSTINKVRFVQEDEWVDAITSQLRPATTSKPIAKDYRTGFNLWPQVTQVGYCVYLRRPATPVFAFSQSGRTITYNVAASTQLEWEDIYIDKIIAKALGYLGINLAEADITQFGQIKDKEQ